MKQQDIQLHLTMLNQDDIIIPTGIRKEVQI